MSHTYTHMPAHLPNTARVHRIVDPHHTHTHTHTECSNYHTHTHIHTHRERERGRENAATTTHTDTHAHTHIHTERERERERERENAATTTHTHTRTHTRWPTFRGIRPLKHRPLLPPRPRQRKFPQTTVSARGGWRGRVPAISSHCVGTESHWWWRPERGSV